ncbi:tripartite tricarboxylate transporter substrate-binding protein [Nonomuraea sp. M3C6]|uniref:Tripartite tricarboxylate transporter substrate-binding protein n=1 Tax=Nonomuraea marmarensis TaxID=3351344 RepID=A0ABW7AJM5_9ACTN
MRRRRFFAWGLGVAACAAGCGTEHVNVGALRTRFSINPGAQRWARVCRAFSGAARAAGYETGTGTKITVTGLPALAAAELNNGQTLADTATPLSRLTGDVEVVVVPGNSLFKDFDDFGAHLLAHPGQTLLAGGPQGEPDHLLFGLIAKGLGADTRQVDYTGYPSSQEAVTALLSGKAAAAAGLFSDWRASIGDGRVRALAVSSAARVPDLDVPTLLESGVRVDFADWVAAVGPDAMTDDSREVAIRMCEEVTGSPGWQSACRANGWISIPLSGDDFEAWLGTEVERTRAVLRDLGLLDTTRATRCGIGCGNGH